MHRQHAPPVPVAGKRVGGRRAALGRRLLPLRRSTAEHRARGLRAPARPRAPASASAPSRHRRRARRATLPSAIGSSAAIDSTEAPCGCAAHDLREAERAVGGQREATRCTTMRAAICRARSARKASRSDRVAAAGVLDRHRRAERQQRDREVAVGRGREEIAADRRHGAHGRPADLARDGMQERRGRDAPTIFAMVTAAPISARPPSMRIASRPSPSESTRRADGEVAAVHVADGERSPAEEAGARIGGQELRRADGRTPPATIAQQPCFLPPPLSSATCPDD